MNNNCPPIITQSCEEDYAIQQKSEPNGHSNCRFLIKELKGSSLLDHDPLMCNFRNDVLLFEACSKFSFLIKHLVDHSGDHQDEIKKRLSFPSGPRGDWTGKFDISDTLEIVTDLTQYVHDRYCDYPVIEHLNDADAKIREFASRRDGNENSYDIEDYFAEGDYSFTWAVGVLSYILLCGRPAPGCSRKYIEFFNDAIIGERINHDSLSTQSFASQQVVVVNQSAVWGWMNDDMKRFILRCVHCNSAMYYPNFSCMEDVVNDTFFTYLNWMGPHRQPYPDCDQEPRAIMGPGTIDFDAMYEEDSDSNSSEKKKPSPKKLKFPTTVNSKETKAPQPDTNFCTNNVSQKPTDPHTASEIIVKSYIRRKPKIKQCKVSSKSKTPVHRNKNSVDLPTLQLIRSMEKECFDQAKKKNKENPSPQIVKASMEWKELFKNRNINSQPKKR